MYKDVWRTEVECREVSRERVEDSGKRIVGSKDERVYKRGIQRGDQMGDTERVYIYTEGPGEGGIGA